MSHDQEVVDVTEVDINLVVDKLTERIARLVRENVVLETIAEQRMIQIRELREELEEIELAKDPEPESEISKDE